MSLLALNVAAVNRPQEEEQVGLVVAFLALPALILVGIEQGDKLTVTAG